MAINKTTTNGTTNKSLLILKIIFFCVFTFSIILSVYLIDISKSRFENTTDYIESWTVTDSSGNSIKTGRSYTDERALSEDFIITARLPDKIEQGQVLYFQNRSNVKVFINGELRKSFDRVKDTGVPGGSMKEFYITVPISPDDAGTELKMIRYRTDWNPVVAPETFVTTSNGVYSYIISMYGVSFALTIVLFAASILVLIVAVFICIFNKLSMDMIYAAIGILDVSCWLISVSQFTPFVSGIYYADGLIAFLFSMMIPFPLLIYVDLIQKKRYHKMYVILFAVTLVNFIFWSALHFTGVLSFQKAMGYIDFILAGVSLCVTVTFINDIRNKQAKSYYYTAIGFLSFVVFSLIEIITLLFNQNDSSLISMITGLISLLIMVVIQQISDTVKEKTALKQELYNKSVENEQMLIHIVQTLAGTIDAKDTYTNGHSGRVASYSREIAKRFGYNDAEQNDIYIMGLLHDIGKIGIPDAVINKPGKLTDEEYEIIKKHPVIGANILSNITEKPELALGAKWHHEKYNGRGYPDGIKGEDIPEQARIVAVADAYDAMTSCRSYREPMPQELVKKEIKDGAGTQFDPRFAEIMLEIISEDINYDLREKK